MADPGSRLYRLCLRALPADFRSRHRSVMERAFEDLMAEAREKGRWGAARCVFWECLDVLAQAGAMRIGRIGSGLSIDLRAAVRSLWKRPGLSGLVLVTLALGIGANTAVYSIVSGVLLKPLPYPSPDAIVRFIGTYEAGTRDVYVSYPDFYDVRRKTSVFAAAAAYRPWGPALAGDGEPERLDAMMVSEGFFEVLGIDAAIGRTFRPEEDLDGRDRVALGLAALAMRWRVALSADTIPLASEIALDHRVLVFTSVVAILTGLAGAVGPALILGRGSPGGSLRAGGTRATTPGTRQLRLRGVMVTSQVSLSVLLLLGAGLLTRSLAKLSSVDPGVSTGVLTFRLSPGGTRYADDESLARFYGAIEERLEAVPGVRQVAFTTGLPMTGRSTCGTLFSEEEPMRFRPEDVCAEARAVSPDYFEVMGIPVQAGRALEEEDQPASPSVVVINRTTAELLWPGQDPLGHRLATGPGGDDLNGFRLFRVIGVVPDVKQFRLDEPAPPQTYLSLAQWPRSARSVIVQGEGELASLVPALRRAVWAVDDQMPVTELAVLRDVVEESLAGAKFRTLLLTAFALLALALTVAGLYGVVSYSVTRRRREIAVRLALGAAPASVLRMIVREGLGVVLPGVAIGVLGALGASSLLDALLYGVTPWDPASFMSVPLVVLAVSAFASVVPALRTLRLHPASCLKTE